MKNYKTACPKISCGHLQDRGDCLREVLTILGFDWENFDGVNLDRWLLMGGGLL